MDHHAVSVRKNTTFFLQSKTCSHDRLSRPDQAALATRAVAETLDRLGRRVFAKQDLLRLIGKHREEWRILDRVPPRKIIDYLLTAFPLRKIVLDGPDHSQQFNRYLWREADPLEVASSVRSPNSHLGN